MSAFFEKEMYKIYYLLFIFLIFPFHINAAVDFVDVNAKGFGSSYQEALNNALTEAIGQVHGKSIDSQKMSLSIEASSTTNESDEYFSSDEYSSVVKEKTKGVVSSYQIIEADDSSGEWVLDVVAQVGQYKKSKSADRKRIVIVPSKAGKNTFSVLGEMINGQKIANKMDQALSDGFVQTRKFAMLDRKNTDALDSELALAVSGKAATEEAARIGQSLVSDFVLVGTLDRLQYSTTTKKMRTSDKTYTVGAGNASFSYSFIEVATSQVFFSDTVKTSISHNELSNAGHNNAGLVSEALVSALSKKLVKAFVDQIYPLAIISRRGGEVILSEGGKRLSVGDSYRVYKRGEKIYDPYTKEFSGYEELYCCVVMVNRVAPKQSYATITKGSSSIPDVVPARSFVLREKVKKPQSKAIKPKKISKEDKGW
jgi:curli biogenesis system outer membrane secretion channel CsgG